MANNHGGWVRTYSQASCKVFHPIDLTGESDSDLRVSIICIVYIDVHAKFELEWQPLIGVSTLT